MLDDVLADLGEGHREAHRRLRIEVELAQHQLRLLLNAPDDVVHVLALRDARDLEEHIRIGAAGTLRIVAVKLIQFLGVSKKSRACPVGRRFVQLGHGERRPLRAGLRERE